MRQLERYLVERSSLHIKHFTFMAYNDFAGKRGTMDLYSAVSGIEQALWDIAGKRFGVPVYNLLGGPCRDKIRVYASEMMRRYGVPDSGSMGLARCRAPQPPSLDFVKQIRIHKLMDTLLTRLGIHEPGRGGNTAQQGIPVLRGKAEADDFMPIPHR